MQCIGPMREADERQRSNVGNASSSKRWRNANIIAVRRRNARLRRFAVSSFPAALTMSQSINTWLLGQH
jgi:hypothetical protein